jgi:phosphatidate cytidylyltransferase
MSSGRIRDESLDDEATLRAARRERAALRRARAEQAAARERELEREQTAAVARRDDRDDGDDGDEEAAGEGRRGRAAAPRRPERRPARRAAQPPRERSRGRSSELLGRIAVAIPAALVAIIFVDLGGTAFALLMALVAVLCLHELYRMLERWHPAANVGYAAAVAMVAAARFGSDRTVLEIAMIALPVTFLAVVASGRTRLATVSIAGTLLGIYWVAFAFAHAELLRRLPHGDGILIDIMIGTFLADTGAYFGGRLFGHRPLAPEISPNKTVEGLLLGMLTAILAVFLAGRFQQTWLTSSQALLLGLAVAVLGPLGDLFESLVKRDAGTKDAGTLFGAHGGALDRLDAVMFTVVAGYYVWVGVLH